MANFYSYPAAILGLGRREVPREASLSPVNSVNSEIENPPQENNDYEDPSQENHDYEDVAIDNPPPRSDANNHTHNYDYPAYYEAPFEHIDSIEDKLDKLMNEILVNREEIDDLKRERSDLKNELEEVKNKEKISF